MIADKFCNVSGIFPHLRFENAVEVSGPGFPAFSTDSFCFDLDFFPVFLIALTSFFTVEVTFSATSASCVLKISDSLDEASPSSFSLIFF